MYELMLNNGVCMSISTVVQIGFDSERYIVSETDGEAVVKVRLISDNLSSPVTVRLTTEDGSAIGVCIYIEYMSVYECLLVYLICIEPDDYTSVVRDIIFSPGDVEFDVTTIPIIDDTLFERIQEDFFAHLELITNNSAVFILPETAEISINDNDGL